MPQNLQKWHCDTWPIPSNSTQMHAHRALMNTRQSQGCRRQKDSMVCHCCIPASRGLAGNEYLRVGLPCRLSSHKALRSRLPKALRSSRYQTGCHPMPIPQSDRRSAPATHSGNQQTPAMSPTARPRSRDGSQQLGGSVAGCRVIQRHCRARAAACIPSNGCTIFVQVRLFRRRS